MSEQVDIEAVEKILTAYCAALNLSDAKGLSALFTEDGVFMPSGAPSLLGRETIKKVSENYFGNTSVKIAFELQDIEVDGNYAFIRARSRSIAQKASTGEKQASLGQDFFVLHKEQQQWKVCKYIFNSQNKA